MDFRFAPGRNSPENLILAARYCRISWYMVYINVKNSVINPKTQNLQGSHGLTEFNHPKVLGLVLGCWVGLSLNVRSLAELRCAQLSSTHATWHGANAAVLDGRTIEGP